MQKFSIKNLFFNIVAMLFAIAFLFGGIYFLSSNYNIDKNIHSISINDTKSLIKKSVKADENQSQFTLTINVDENFEYFYIKVNGDIIEVNIQSGVYSNTYFKDTELEFEYKAKSGYRFKQYFSYNTDDNDILFLGINNNKFNMPDYNLTINVSSIQVRTITIYKKIYQSQDRTELPVTETSRYTIEYGSNRNINLTVANCHKTQINGKDFLSYNGYDNIEYFSGELRINNVIYDDEIEVYFEKNYYNCSVYFGSNTLANDGKGGSFDINENKYIFNKTNINGVISFNVYLNSDIVLKNITSNNGYRFSKVFVKDQNDFEIEDENLIISQMDTEGNITISGISSAIKIYIQFIKINQVNVSISSLKINNVQTKVGKIGFEFESLTYSDIIRDIDDYSSISIVTEIDQEFNNTYEFKHWEIKDKDGKSIGTDNYGLTEEDLKLSTLTIEDIDCDMYINAIYGIKTFSVSVVFEGNGSIEVENNINENYEYAVQYGNDIILKLIPKNNMHFVKSTELIKLENENIETENMPSKTDKETYLEYKIANVTQNLKVKVVFVKNTWWEHIETEELTGKGTKNDPYLISSASDLAFISKSIYYGESPKDIDCVDYTTAYFVLKNDIDCEKNYYFMPLGIQTNRLHPNFNIQFNGTFDYNYHNITNMWTEEDVSIYQYEGLFDSLGPNAKILNRYRDYTILIVTIVSGFFGFALVVRIVFFVEKRRNKPKRVITLKNYKNQNDINE